MIIYLTFFLINKLHFCALHKKNDFLMNIMKLFLDLKFNFESSVVQLYLSCVNGFHHFY